jgi:uncharacterized iron-regulated membrane protein
MKHGMIVTLAMAVVGLVMFGVTGCSKEEAKTTAPVAAAPAAPAEVKTDAPVAVPAPDAEVKKEEPVAAPAAPAEAPAAM